MERWSLGGGGEDAETFEAARDAKDREGENGGDAWNDKDGEMEETLKVGDGDTEAWGNQNQEEEEETALRYLTKTLVELAITHQQLPLHNSHF